MARLNFRTGAIAVTITAAAVGITAAPAPVRVGPAPATAGSPVSALFSWQGENWCPTYRGGDGCGNVQADGDSSATFHPSQVSYAGSSNSILLTTNQAATATGAFNTQGYEAWSAPATLTERINLPCDRSGRIENWPAFWLVTPGAWPAGGEIDVMEGLNGSAAWHYHYLSSRGRPSSVGGMVPGFSGCGTHTYAVSWTTSAITFSYDGRPAGRITSRQIGVPIVSGPMYLINDYATSSVYGGPTAGNVTMQVLGLTHSGRRILQPACRPEMVCPMR
jgi:glycosyl hydrolase family 16